MLLKEEKDRINWEDCLVFPQDPNFPPKEKREGPPANKKSKTGRKSRQIMVYSKCAHYPKCPKGKYELSQTAISETATNDQESATKPLLVFSAGDGGEEEDAARQLQAYNEYGPEHRKNAYEHHKVLPDNTDLKKFPEMVRQIQVTLETLVSGNKEQRSNSISS